MPGADALAAVADMRSAVPCYKLEKSDPATFKRRSAPGIDGLTADLFLLLVDDAKFIEQLQALFYEWHREGQMGEASRTAVMSTMYKNKGERSDWAMHRPVSVTTILYRIYRGCLEQCLARAMPFIIGDSQVGYAQRTQAETR